MSKKEKVRIAIIGCGKIAQLGHLPYLAGNRSVELAAGVDINEKNRESISRKYNMRGYDSPEEMFARERPDAVFICTPSWVHKDLTLMAAGNGAHVFVEKPMAVNAKECTQMLKACEKAGLHLQVGMVKRFDQGIVKTKKIIESGKLGEVSSITTSFINPPARMDTPVYETAKKWANAIGIDLEERYGVWRMTDPRAGGGNLMEMGTHFLDMILYFAGEEPSDYYGFINKKRSDMIWEDQGTIVVKFPSGLIGTVELNMSVTADNLLGEKGTVYGEKGSVAFNLINGMWFGLPFFYYIPTFVTRYHFLSPMTGLGVPVPVKTGKKVFMHKRQIDYFVDTVLGRDTDYYGFGGDFATSGRDGLAVMKIIDRVYKTAKKEEK